MSIIGKKPYIHSILSALSANGLSRLQTLVDSIDFNNGIQVRLSRLSSDLTAGSTGNEYHVWFVQLAFDDYNGKVAKGFLIENASASHEFGFFSFQKNVEAMASYKISSPSGLDGSFSYEDMHENLHAEEFRRCLDDYLEQEVPDMKVTAANIDSGEAASGKVLSANGTGGASWTDAPQPLDIGGIINLGTLNVIPDINPVKPPSAYFEKSISSSEYSAIPDNGLMIFMFNTSCVCIPFVKGGTDNRFVVSTVVSAVGGTRVSRALCKINTTSIYIKFDDDTASAMYNGGFTTYPYGIVRFIGL